MISAVRGDGKVVIRGGRRSGASTCGTLGEETLFLQLVKREGLCTGLTFRRIVGASCVVSQRIAVFGGSFNPPGKHHRLIAELLAKDFDKVLVVPCGPRPDKATTQEIDPDLSRRPGGPGVSGRAEGRDRQLRPRVRHLHAHARVAAALRAAGRALARDRRGPRRRRGEGRIVHPSCLAGGPAHLERAQFYRAPAARL